MAVASANGEQGDDVDDDEAEEAGKDDKPKGKKGGQNTHRSFGSSRDAIALCIERARVPEFDSGTCPRGDACRYEHNITLYLKEGKREDLTTLNGMCPVFEECGMCNAGWRCRFAASHTATRTLEDGRVERYQIEDEDKVKIHGKNTTSEGLDVVNSVEPKTKIAVRKKQIDTSKSEDYNKWLDKITNSENDKKKPVLVGSDEEDEAKDNAARYVDPPFLPSEKRRLYYGPETPILAPLTTQGNLPFRRLAVELGAQVTWSEMAMGLPLIQGEKGEWALMKAHKSELEPPRILPTSNPIAGYDRSKDLRFGVQLAANKPWLALKATEVVTKLCPHIRAVDLNCGCPIDLVYRQGAGSALMDSPARLEKMIRGMNAVSGEVPVQIKVRTGTKDNRATASKLVERFLYGGAEAATMRLGSAGAAAIALHGRSRQQRYTRLADWKYIAECAALVDGYNKARSDTVDTAGATDPRDTSNGGRMYFIGNGDCFSQADYFEHIDNARVDSVMIGRGALIKPWIFEEIEKKQYLDKSATERLGYVEKFAKYGLQAWGSDEIGVGVTRRFLLEWLSFACRYVPIGLLEHLPPSINDRPPAYRGRNDLETLMASGNVKDWVKISEMFLGPAHKDFKFLPKHKSNSYDNEAEG